MSLLGLAGPSSPAHQRPVRMMRLKVLIRAGLVRRRRCFFRATTARGRSSTVRRDAKRTSPLTSWEGFVQYYRGGPQSKLDATSVLPSPR